MKKRQLITRIISFLICLFFILSIFPSCKGQVSVNTSSDTQTNVSTLTNQTTKYTIDSTKKNIVFIGNSLTYVGKIPRSLDIAAFSGKEAINIVDLTESGFTLGQHVDKLKDSQYDSVFKGADIVIFQEYGAPAKDTAKNLKILMDRFNPEAKMYFLLTELDLEINREEELKDIAGITYVPSGYVHQNLLKKGFKYEQFHLANDYHPNELYGYIAALTLYSVLFKKPIDDIPYEFIDISSQVNIYNPTEQTKCGNKESKNECMKEIKQVIKDTTEEYQKKG